MLKTFEYFLKTYLISFNFCKNIFFNKLTFFVYISVFFSFFFNIFIFL